MKAWMLLIIMLITGCTAMAGTPTSKKTVAPASNPPIKANCDKYIDSGTWVYMFIKDPSYEDNYQFNEWTLSLKPTECGRNIDPTETAYMFYEIVKKFGQNEHWANNRGMINQLTCHLYIARTKDTWNLEPWRPYVGYAKTVSAQCNPIVPDPDPDWH